MKKFVFIFIVFILGMDSFAQMKSSTTAIPDLIPDLDFMVLYQGNWNSTDIVQVSNVTSSTDPNYIEIGGGAMPQVFISHDAFINTVPLYTLGYIRARITVKNANNVPYKVATVQINNIYYYNYSVFYIWRVCEYYIPNTAWSYIANPIDDERMD